MSGRETPLMRTSKRSKGAAAREDSTPFSFKFFLLTMLTALCVFAATIAFIRYWQRVDPLEAWLRATPRFQDAEPSQAAEKAAHKSSTAGKAAPWLGADASVLDASLLAGRRGSMPGPSAADGWWQRRQAEELQALDDLAKDSAELHTTAQHPRDVAMSGGQAATKNELLSALLTRKDLVIAIPTHKGAEPQLKAGRAARLGIRTFVVTNYTVGPGREYPTAENEVWSFYPDAQPARSFYPGDDRAALAPFLAHRNSRKLGETFKWMFYGDDDTVFMAEAALKLASEFDHMLPYLITDNFWWSEQFDLATHPHPLAPRCLPCGYTNGENVTRILGMKLVAGCPCTPQLMCSAKGGYNGTFSPRACGVPRTPGRSYSMHGGAGALISIGLLQRVDWTSMERCVNHQWSSGGDAFLTDCLWEQGFGHTTPDPLWHPAGLQMFDPSPPPLNPDDFILPKAAHVMGNLLQQAAGVCRGLCQLEYENTVTVHLRGRRVGGTNETAATFIRAFSRLYSRVTGYEPSAEQLGVGDTSNLQTAATAAAIDRQLEAGIELVRQLCTRPKVGSEPLAAALDALQLQTDFGQLAAGDQVQAGIADAVAERILNNMLVAAQQSDIQQ